MSAAPPSARQTTEVVVNSIFVAIAMAGLWSLLQQQWQLQTAWQVMLGVLLVALPLNLAERVLAVRSGAALIVGMQKLTRDADAPRFWRAPAYLSVLLALVASAYLTLMGSVAATQLLQSSLHQQDGLWHAELVLPVVAVLLLALAMLRHLGHASMLWLFILMALLAVAAYSQQQQISMPLTAGVAWPSAAAISPLLQGALLGGAGLLARWPEQQAVPRQAPTLQFAMFLLAGLAIVAAMLNPLVSAITVLMAALLAITVLLSPLYQALRSRGMSTLASVVLMFALVQLLVEGTWYFFYDEWLTELLQVLAVAMALNAILVAIFVGWLMKISHARKALSLPNEWSYNLWRIAVRWVAPLTLLLAIWQSFAADAL